MYVAVLLFVYYLWEADAKEEEKGPSSYQLYILMSHELPTMSLMFVMRV